MSELRQILYVSDGTGLTAEAYGSSLLAQFPGLEFESGRLPFVDSEARAREVINIIKHLIATTDTQPIIFCTLVDRSVQALIASSGACVIDLFQTFIGPLEIALDIKSAHTQGLSHQVVGKQIYQDRLNAIDYALQHDDGVRPDQYTDADVVLVGVSRCGKTPTSLYIAMNFYIKAANYPITDDELDRDVLPESLKPWKSKLVGLTIEPRQLAHIREQRRPGSEYAALDVCKREVRSVEQMFTNERIPVLDMTNTSIEEIAGNILKEKGLVSPSAL